MSKKIIYFSSLILFSCFNNTPVYQAKEDTKENFCPSFSRDLKIACETPLEWINYSGLKSTESFDDISLSNILRRAISKCQSFYPGDNEYEHQEVCIKSVQYTARKYLQKVNPVGERDETSDYAIYDGEEETLNDTNIDSGRPGSSRGQ